MLVYEEEVNGKLCLLRIGPSSIATRSVWNWRKWWLAKLMPRRLAVELRGRGFVITKGAGTSLTGSLLSPNTCASTPGRNRSLVPSAATNRHRKATSPRISTWNTAKSHAFTASHGRIFSHEQEWFVTRDASRFRVAYSEVSCIFKVF